MKKWFLVILLMVGVGNVEAHFTAPWYSGIFAPATPVQIGVWPFSWGIQLFPSGVSVYGVAVGLPAYRVNTLYGLKAAPVAIQNMNYAFGCSVVDFSARNYGFTLALYAVSLRNNALQTGAVNDCAIANNGVMLGVVNLAAGKRRKGSVKNIVLYQDDINLQNDEARQPIKNSVQIGVVNLANHGWQLGLFNYNQNSILPYTVLFNYSSPESDKGNSVHEE